MKINPDIRASRKAGGPIYLQTWTRESDGRGGTIEHRRRFILIGYRKKSIK